jgi:hypothetical protein
MRRIVSRVQVNDDRCWWLPPGAQEGVHQEVIEDDQAACPRGVPVAEGRPVFRGQFVLSARGSVLEAGEGGTAGEWLLRVRSASHQGLEEGIVPEPLRIVAVGIPSEDLIDLLGEERFGRVAGELGGTRVGSALGQVGQQAELLFKVSHEHQASVGNDLAASEGDGDLLAGEGPEGKV